MRGGKFTMSPVSSKVIIIGVLTLALLVPSFMIMSLVSERENRRDGAVIEVSGKWGGQQTITGPVIMVPFVEHQDVDEWVQGVLIKKKVEIQRYAFFLPEDLGIGSEVDPVMRHRGIYDVPLYNARIALRGSFGAPDMGAFGVPPENVQWEKAALVLGISDLKGIRDGVTVSWNGEDYGVVPGSPACNLVESGLSADVRLDPSRKVNEFSINLNINGSLALMFHPVGKTTAARLVSKWSSPSFIGDFLPEAYEIGQGGVKADWKVLFLNRNYPQSWVGEKYRICGQGFGMKLYTPVDVYQKTMRTAKYAVLFILIAFLAFFMIEVLKGRRLHPVQYLLVGVAIVVFYTLLLSLSEHIGFEWAYMVASLALIAQTTAYAKSMLKGMRPALVVSAVYAVLYGYMFVVVQLEDFALLAGSLGVFAIVATVMYLTRKVEWYGKGSDVS